MEGDLIWKALEVVFIGLTAAVTVGLFFRAKNVALHDRITRLEDKYNDLSVACLRREEFHTSLEPIRGDIADLRRRIDDFINLFTKAKKS